MTNAVNRDIKASAFFIINDIGNLDIGFRAIEGDKLRLDIRGAHLPKKRLVAVENENAVLPHPVYDLQLCTADILAGAKQLKV